MEFDKSKVYTALNADELKVGSKVVVAETLEVLRKRVRNCDIFCCILHKVLSPKYIHRFQILNDEGDTFEFLLAYLIEEPQEQGLKWTDLKIGDIISKEDVTFMVTGVAVNTEIAHIHAGSCWLSNEELKDYIKVEAEK